MFSTKGLGLPLGNHALTLVELRQHGLLSVKTDLISLEVRYVNTETCDPPRAPASMFASLAVQFRADHNSGGRAQEQAVRSPMELWVNGEVCKQPGNRSIPACSAGLYLRHHHRGGQQRRFHQIVAFLIVSLDELNTAVDWVSAPRSRLDVLDSEWTAPRKLHVTRTASPVPGHSYLADNIWHLGSLTTIERLINAPVQPQLLHSIALRAVMGATRRRELGTR